MTELYSAALVLVVYNGSMHERIWTDVASKLSNGVAVRWLTPPFFFAAMISLRIFFFTKLLTKLLFPTSKIDELRSLMTQFTFIYPNHSLLG